jgi:hypothetical protein
MHETLDPTDRLFVERDLREPDRHELEHRRSIHAAPRHESRLRGRVGRVLIRLGAAIAAEPIEAGQHHRPAVRVS